MWAAQREAGGCFYPPAELCFQGGTSSVCPAFGHLSGYPAVGAKGAQTWQVQEGCGSKSKVYAPIMRKLQILGYRVWAKGEDADSCLLLLHPSGLYGPGGCHKVGRKPVVPMQPDTLTLTFPAGELGFCRTYPWGQDVLWPRLWPRKTR